MHNNGINLINYAIIVNTRPWVGRREPREAELATKVVLNKITSPQSSGSFVKACLVQCHPCAI